jgi:transposase
VRPSLRLPQPAYAAGKSGAGHPINFAELVAATIPEHARDKPIELWWQDEARVGQQGSLTYVWADKGSRPRAPRDQRYDWAYLFGAVCPARGAGAGLVLPFVNTEAMNLHLAEISAKVMPGAHAVIPLDGAGWHQTGGKLNLPDNISLLPLPPYSPELNPVENIWQFLRQNHLANRVFDTYTGIVDACCEAWNALIAAPDKIRSIATRSWAEAVNA